MSLSIQLFGFPKAPNSPSVSGYCQKLETFLRAQPVLAKSYTYTYLLTPSKAPKGKMPYVVLTDTSKPGAPPLTLADSQFIIDHLVSSGHAEDLDAGLSPMQRVESRAFQVWTDESTYLAVATTRFGDAWPANYASFYRTTELPGILNYAPFKSLIVWNLRRTILNAMDGHGVGRHSKEEVEVKIKEWVDGVATKVGEDGEWFHRTKGPTQVDVVLSGFLMHFMSLEYNAETVQMIKEQKGLVRYTIRAVELFFPEYEELLEALRSYL